MATIAVGDIHGNVEALDDLLTLLVPDLAPDDEVVFLGDYIDDGPDVPGCISRIIELRDRGPCRVVALMGNHEQWMLRSLTDPTRHSWLLGMAGLRTVKSYSEEAAAALQREVGERRLSIYLGADALSYGLFFDAMPPAHLDFFRTLRVFHQTPDVLCVHGGAPDVGAVEAYPDETLIWGPPGFPESYEGTAPVVYGHHNNADVDDDGWPRPRVTRECVFGIDTIRHGVLTAMRFPDRRIIQSRRFHVEE